MKPIVYLAMLIYIPAAQAEGITPKGCADLRFLSQSVIEARAEGTTLDKMLADIDSVRDKFEVLWYAAVRLTVKDTYNDAEKGAPVDEIPQHRYLECMQKDGHIGAGKPVVSM